MTLPDILAPNLDVIFCGINPGLTAATSGHHFIRRSNRFWRVIHQAGFTPVEIDPIHDSTILQHRCGLTTVVARPTAGAGELTAADFLAAAAPFAQKIQLYAPRFIAFLGKPAYAALSAQRQIAWGLQPTNFAGAIAWVLPNPSGRNLAFGIDQLVEEYRKLYREVHSR